MIFLLILKLLVFFVFKIFLMSSWILLLNFLFYIVIQNTSAGYHEKRLLRFLFNSSRYDAHNALERPVKNESEALEVLFGTTLTQIIDVDEKNQIIKTSIWLSIMWKDYHFHWDPNEYGGITMINMIPNTVWMPDVLLYNSADDKFNAANPVKVVISYDGSMRYVPPGLFKSTCTMDVTWFPFDIQNCKLKFGTWSYNGNDVNLKLDQSNLTDNDGVDSELGNVDLLYYSKSGEWTLISAGLQRNVQRYACCAVDYIDVKMTIIIGRRITYYLFNFVLPCIIISAVALLDFLLPSDAGEKISLGVTIMLSLSMFQLLLADNMPQSSLSIPLLALYFLSMMILSTLSLLFTVIVLNCHHNDHSVPKFVKVVINQWLAKLLLISLPESICSSQNGRSKKISNYINNSIYDSKVSHSLLANVLELSSDTHNIYQNLITRKKSIQEFETCVDSSSNGECQNIEGKGIICSLDEEIKKIKYHLKFITLKIKENDEEGDKLKEWKFAAYVIDRFCVITFTLLAFCVTAGIFFSPATRIN